MVQAAVARGALVPDQVPAAAARPALVAAPLPPTCRL